MMKIGEEIPEPDEDGDRVRIKSMHLVSVTYVAMPVTTGVQITGEYGSPHPEAAVIGSMTPEKLEKALRIARNLWDEENA